MMGDVDDVVDVDVDDDDLLESPLHTKRSNDYQPPSKSVGGPSTISSTSKNSAPGPFIQRTDIEESYK